MPGPTGQIILRLMSINQSFQPRSHTPKRMGIDSKTRDALTLLCLQIKEITDSLKLKWRVERTLRQVVVTEGPLFSVISVIRLSG